ncbi:MAG: YXWGXW repeat-containing protein [Gemmatimonadaceae bacterium]
MSKYLLVRLTAALVAVGAAGACAANPRPRVGVEYAMRQPPAERVEVLSASPGAGYVWVKGHWAWRRDDYEWIGGHWAIPERGFREWEPGRWEHDRNGWFFIEGRWR